MKKLIKPVCIASLFLLSACGEQGVKLQVEPTLPVPVLIVPDHGSSNTPVNNPNAYPNNDPNAPYQRNGQDSYPYQQGNHRRGGNNNQQYERDYRYGN